MLTFMHDWKYNTKGSILMFDIRISHSYLVMVVVQFDILHTPVITTKSIWVP